MHVKLRTGMFETAPKVSPDDNSEHQMPSALERKCLLVYPGKFQSLDGEVDVTDEHIERLATTHNSIVNSLKRMAEGAGLPMKACPPIQLDHSRSGWDTVGRLVGPVEISDYQLEDGQNVKALFGTARILGRDNVERVQDGRWTHLSIGADLESGVLSELTITPFPAAANASLLRQAQLPGRVDEAKWSEAKAAAHKSYPDLSESNDRFWEIVSTIYKNMGGEFHKTHMGKPDVPAQPAPSTKGDPMKVGFSSYLAEACKMAEEEQKTHIEKMRKRLMDKEQLSAEDADKKLGEMPHEECKRMMDESTEEEQKEKKLAALTGARTKLTELQGKLTKGADSLRLAARKAGIQSRLSKLKAEAKITPAEIKKLDITKLAAGTDETIAAALDTFSAREPQVLVGVFGSANATSVKKLSEDRKKAVRMAKMEVEARKNMGRDIPDTLKRMAEGEEEAEVNVHIDTTPHTEYFEAGEWEEMKALMGAGKDEEAKAVFGRVLTRHTKKLTDPASSEEAAYMGATEDEMKQLQAQVEEAVRLTSVLAEATA